MTNRKLKQVLTLSPFPWHCAVGKSDLIADLLDPSYTYCFLGSISMLSLMACFTEFLKFERIYTFDPGLIK